MYKLHLILKYLRKRRIAWVSLIAVTLCTAMVIVVISVMGGWLRMFKESFHDITGDIVISRRALTGFAHYQEMIERIERLPEVAAATPTLRTFGLINIMVGPEARIRDMVQVIGLKLDKIDKVNGFRRSLYRQYQLPAQRLESNDVSDAEQAALKQRMEAIGSFEKPLAADDYRMVLPNSRVDVSTWPGMIVGAGVVGVTKDENGNVVRPNPEDQYRAYVQLTTVALSEDASSPDLKTDSTVKNYWIVDDSRTKVWQYDSSTVYVPFDVLQRDLRMEEQTATNVETNAPIVIPARTNDIHIGLKPGQDVWAAKQKIQRVVDEVLMEKGEPLVGIDPVLVQTWQEFNGKYISAVEKEKVLVTMLFGIISVVAIFLIFCIFYMIVVEKTRDIGIIKSVGATSRGVAGIFLGYGMAIGIVGSLLGLLVGYLIVTNINYLHTKLGELLNVQIWNPEVYAFDVIPNTMEPREIAVIMAVAIVASVLGALVPALRAARLHPVEALRWE